MNGGSGARRGNLWFVAVAAALLGALPVRAQMGPVDRSGTPGPGSSDAELMAHVLDRLTYGRSEAMWARIQGMGVDNFIRWQLNPEGIAEGQELLTKLAALPPTTSAAPTWDLPHLYGDFLVRATFASRQLNEVMAEFWENHFDTLVPPGDSTNGERQRNTNWLRLEKQGFRDRALGRFRDILAISAKSPAMMYFLDNYRNRASSGNENYARELMELHTLGVDNYYIQRDVEEVARVFTGWTLTDLSTRCDVTDTDGKFCYNQAAHDNRQKIVLGRTIAAGRGMDEGEEVLDLLAAHPGTARFVCEKLVQKFVADAAPARLVDECTGAFLRSGGDMRAVLTALFFSPEFRLPAYRLNKVVTPLEYVIRSIRNLEGDMDTIQSDRQGNIWNWVASLGQPVFQNAVPTGYSELGTVWMGTNSVLWRWKWADAFTHELVTNARYHCDPWSTANRLGIRTPEAIVGYFLGVLVRGHHDGAVEMADLTAALMNGQASFVFDSQATRDGIRNMVSLMLGLPEHLKQ